MGIPNLKLLFEDDIGLAYAHYWDGKWVIHSDLFDEPTPATLKRVKAISALIDNGFKEKGVSTLYTWAENEEQDRYNKFLGYSPTGKTVNDTFQAKDYPREVREYKKELI